MRLDNKLILNIKLAVNLKLLSYSIILNLS